jgi:enoyl-CoA hydratase/carnithine racemase
MMDAFDTITCEIAGPVAAITLNRPEVRNAMSARMVEDLLACFTALGGDEGAGVRVVVLRAAGEVFCAGGDVHDLSSASGEKEQADTGAQLDALLRMVRDGPQVVIVRVQGPALGGGLGLVCVADIAVASEHASFALPEVRLGLAPAVISPYVVARVGMPRARQFMLTGRRITAAQARENGLVQEVCANAELDATVGAAVTDVLKCAPSALRACKQLLAEITTNPESLAYRVALLNQLRAGDEAQQGMLAFLAKQPAPWVPRNE